MMALVHLALALARLIMVIGVSLIGWAVDDWHLVLDRGIGGARRIVLRRLVVTSIPLGLAAISIPIVWVGYLQPPLLISGLILLGLVASRLRLSPLDTGRPEDRPRMEWVPPGDLPEIALAAAAAAYLLMVKAVGWRLLPLMLLLLLLFVLSLPGAVAGAGCG